MIVRYAHHCSLQAKPSDISNWIFIENSVVACQTTRCILKNVMQNCDGFCALQ